MRWVCGVTPTPKCSRLQEGSISCAHKAAGGGGGLERDANASRKGANREVQPQVSPCRPWAGHLKTSWERASLGPRDPQRLTLGVGLLECVAGIHKAGGRIVFALELQVQLGCLAESISGSWNRREHAQPEWGSARQKPP